MEEKSDRIQHLYQKYADGTILREEIEDMLDYFKAHGIPPELEHLWMEEISDPSFPTPKDIREITDRVESRLLQNLPGTPRYTIRRFIPYAAAIVIALLVGILFMTTYHQFSSPVASQSVADGPDISPASEKATILLSDGRTIALDGDRDGIIMDGQQIYYNDGTSPILELSPSEFESITVKTPRGGIYKVTLPDGSLVWLNAETTLRYPSRFSEHERVVNLEGEAYFSVQRRKELPKNSLGGHQGDTYLPFKVITSDQTVEVLGTEFNISAYTDEKGTKTTLVNGMVSVQSSHQANALILHPGEQAWTDEAYTKKIKVDIGDYTDWKNGEFVFRNEDAQEVMLRIARWYDIELKYQSDVLTGERFSGSISRYDNLYTVLDIMEEASDLNFEVNGRKVVIGKKTKGKNK